MHSFDVYKISFFLSFMHSFHFHMLFFFNPLFHELFQLIDFFHFFFFALRFYFLSFLFSRRYFVPLHSSYITFFLCVCVFFIYRVAKKHRSLIEPRSRTGSITVITFVISSSIIDQFVWPSNQLESKAYL